MTARHRLPVAAPLTRGECSTWSSCSLWKCKHHLDAHLLQPRTQRLLFNDTDTEPVGAREATQYAKRHAADDDAPDQTQFCALAIIEANGESSCEEIADYLGLSKMTVHEELNNALTKFGYGADDVDVISDWREDSDEGLRRDIRGWLAEQNLTDFAQSASCDGRRL